MAKTWRLELGIVVAQIVAIKAALFGHFSGKQTAAQRAVGHQGDIVALAIGLDILFNRPFKDIIWRLTEMQQAFLTKSFHLIAGKNY